MTAPKMSGVKYYLYVLRSKVDGNFYIGVTTRLYNRIKEHNLGKEPSTRHRTPFELVFYEVFFNKLDAYQREKYLKTGWGRKHLRKTLVNTLKS